MADLMPERQVNRRGGGFPNADAAIRALEHRLGSRSAQWEYRNDAGLHVGSVVRWNKPDGKEIRPVSRIGGQWKTEGMPSPRPLYRLPEVQVAGSVVITEGEKAADAAVRLGFEATTSAHGSQSASKTDWSPLAGKEVVILPDNDAAGKTYAAEVAAILASLDPQPTIKIVELPDLPEGGDIADLVESVGDEGLNELRSRVDSLTAEALLATRLEENPPRDEDNKPKIWLLKGEKDRVTDQTLAILASDHFERGGVLVTCLPSPTGKVIAALTEQSVADALNRGIDWARWKEDEEEENGGTEIREDAPGWLPKLIVGMQVRACIRHLEGIHRGPFLRRDGSIGGLRPGYDPQSQYWIETADDWTALETPTTKSQVDESVAIIRELVAEFPFANDTSESVWVALIVTRLARAAFDGPSPLFVLEASTPGSGKTMLGRLAGSITEGKPPGTISFYANEEEMRKTITSMLMAGTAYLFFDNASGRIESPTLDRVLTSTTLIDRLLQVNKIVEVANTTVPLVTANNASFGGDTLRRSLVLRLAPLQEKPEERTFRIADLDKYVLENRRSLLIAAMRILQWFVQCGRPQQPIRPMGSFEEWSALVRQALIHAGLPDPWVAERAIDFASSATEAFLLAWKAWDRNWTGSARQMVEAVFRDPSPIAKNLRDASLELVGSIGSKEGRPDAQALGNHIGRIQGRTFADLRVMKAEKRSASGFVWRLEEVAQTAKK